jgi:hypothetical protein
MWSDDDNHAELWDSTPNFSDYEHGPCHPHDPATNHKPLLNLKKLLGML